MDMVDRHPTDWRRSLAARRGSRHARSLLVALAAGIVLVTLIAATNSVVGAARNISDDATALSETDEQIRAATVARTLTVLAAVAVNDGTTAPSLDEIEAATDVLRSDSASDSQRFRDAVDDTVTTIETGRVPLPEQIAEVENSFGQLLDRLVLDREALGDGLATSESRLNQISSLAGLALLFIVPTLAIAIYRAISRPDVEQRAMAHAAAVDSRITTNRLSAVAAGIQDVRHALGLRAPVAVTDQRLAEINALVGVGADGSLRRRRAVDLRTAAASAINRVELIDAIPVTGSTGPVVVDEDQAVTLFAALLGTIAGRRSPSIQMTDDGTHAVVTVRSAEPVPDLERVDEPELFGEPLASTAARRIGAARSLALDLGVDLERFEDGAHHGYRIRFQLADLGTEALESTTVVASS